MINTSKATMVPKPQSQKIPQVIRVESDAAKQRVPAAVIASWVQIAFMVIAGYILFDSSSKSGKDAWGGMFAYIPIIGIVTIAPLMLILAGFYFVRHKENAISRKLVVGFASLISLFSLLIAL